MLKKNTDQGWKGSITSEYRQGEYTKLSNGANISYGKGKIVIYGGMAMIRRNRYEKLISNVFLITEIFYLIKKQRKLLILII